MSPSNLSKSCTAFVADRLFASGPLIEIVMAIKTAEAAEPGFAALIFDDATGGVVDVDLRGTGAEAVLRLAELDASPGTGPEVAGGEPARGRGRPKLGVVAREVTLLPRHWDWLAAQRGGASQALRRLVEEARRADVGHTDIKIARERTYRFLSAVAGNLPGFEETTRALFAGDDRAFAARMASWPKDIGDYALKLARAVPATGNGN